MHSYDEHSFLSINRYEPEWRRALSGPKPEVFAIPVGGAMSSSGHSQGGVERDGGPGEGQRGDWRKFIYLAGGPLAASRVAHSSMTV